jgi:hypothetical protein
MKISEITDKNVVWQSIMEIDLNFETEFSIAERYASVVLQVTHRSKFHIACQLIVAFKERAAVFLEAKPFDPTDADLIVLQHQVRNMIAQLEKLEKRLV